MITVPRIRVDEGKLTGHDRVSIRGHKTYMAEGLVNCDIFDP
jgi:hypothetical protein